MHGVAGHLPNIGRLDARFGWLPFAVQPDQATRQTMLGRWPATPCINTNFLAAQHDQDRPTSVTAGFVQPQSEKSMQALRKTCVCIPMCVTVPYVTWSLGKYGRHRDLQLVTTFCTVYWHVKTVVITVFGQSCSCKQPYSSTVQFVCGVTGVQQRAV